MSRVPIMNKGIKRLTGGVMGKNIVRRVKLEGEIQVTGNVKKKKMLFIFMIIKGAVHHKVETSNECL